MNREIKEIFYSSKFQKRFKSLPQRIQKKSFKCEKIFRINCFSEFLKTHKLKGQYQNYLVFSIDYSYKIIFRFITEQTVLFIDVGTHNIYQ